MYPYISKISTAALLHIALCTQSAKFAWFRWRGGVKTDEISDLRGLILFSFLILKEQILKLFLEAGFWFSFYNFNFLQIFQVFIFWECVISMTVCLDEISAYCRSLVDRFSSPMPHKKTYILAVCHEITYVSLKFDFWQIFKTSSLCILAWYR